jgi:hypothetical protein
MTRPLITHARLKELFSYNQKTGLFTRRLSMGSRWPAGQVVGTNDGRGYLQVTINRVKYRLHRLAWFYVKGVWPEFDTDHRNRVRSDNRFKNLRDATRAENNHNSGMSRHNTSGYKGVSWSKTMKKWEARITKNNKGKMLGYFDTPELAHAAYTVAKRTIHPTAPRDH